MRGYGEEKGDGFDEEAEGDATPFEESKEPRPPAATWKKTKKTTSGDGRASSHKSTVVAEKKTAAAAKETKSDSVTKMNR